MPPFATFERDRLRRSGLVSSSVAPANRAQWLRAGVASSVLVPRSYLEAVPSQGGGSPIDWWPAPYKGLAIDWYISPTGSSGNSGLSPASPKNLGFLNTGSYGGDTVGLMDGTYNMVDLLGVSTAAFSRGQIEILAGATIVSQSKHGAVLNYQRASNQTNQGALLQPAGSNVSIYGVHFTNGANRTITNHGNGGDNFLLESCLITDHQNPTSGTDNPGSIFLQSHADTTIRNCRFETNAAPGNNRHGHIYVYDWDGLIVEYCSFIGTQSTSGPAIYAKDQGVANVTFRYNYVYSNRSDNDFHASHLWFWSDTASSTHNIHNNVFFRDVASGGRAIVNVNTSESLTGTVNFYNNTCVGPHSGGMTFYWTYLGAPTLSSYNNIFSRPAVNSLGDFDLNTIASLGTWNYNLYDSSPTTEWRYNSGGASVSGLSGWQGVSGKDANSIEDSDPEFTGTGTEAEAYQLQGSSPAKTLGAGSTETGAWFDPSTGLATVQIGEAA